MKHQSFLVPVAFYCSITLAVLGLTESYHRWGKQLNSFKDQGSTAWHRRRYTAFSDIHPMRSGLAVLGWHVGANETTDELLDEAVERIKSMTA